MYALKPKDMEILSLLDQNSRMSVTELAKRLKLSKDGVSYRIKKLEAEKVITRYFADVDVSKLGLTINKFALKFQNVDKDKEDEIFGYLKKHPKIGWVVFCSGAWDCVFVAYVKDDYEIQRMINEIVERYGKHIISKEFLIVPEYFVVNRKWLANSDRTAISRIGGRSDKAVDDLDIKLIKILTQNCRKPIIEIAKEAGASSSLVISRIRRLEKSGAIQNYRIGLDLARMGKEFCKSFVYLQNYTAQEHGKLVDFCIGYPNVTAVTNTIGPWELELEMEVANFDEFYRIMNEIKSRFKHIIRSYEAITITREYGIDYSTII
jgi:Lrp/AsnC family leucine-responsive transcriptional regulator